MSRVGKQTLTGDFAGRDNFAAKVVDETPGLV
jgi:hypothetical protein